MNRQSNAEGAISLDLILDSTENAIVAVDRQGQIVFCNRAVERLLGVKVEDMLGRPVAVHFPNTGLPTVLESGRPQLAQTLLHNDSVLISNRSPVFKDGELIGAVAVFQDITLMQKFVDNLVDEHEKTKELKGTLEAVLDSAYEGLIQVDKDGIVTMMNQSFANFFNTSPERQIGKHIEEVYDNPKFPEVLLTEQPVYGYIHNLNGHEIIASRVPIRRNGAVVGALGKVIFKDVNELYSMAENLNLLKSELNYYKDTLRHVQGAKKTFSQIVTNNPELLQLFDTARKVALTNSTVLIRGESGTGKELFAHALHHESSRWQGPFIKVNCAAVPDTLLESELFGYVDGAFTGARKGGQTGKFELADKGTIFLDEIGDMPLSMQVKLLRVVQEKEIERLGDNKPRKVDVRVITATNRNLEDLIQKREFREDLYYRLNVISLKLPPLRERIDDIPILLKHFVEKFNREFGCRVESIEEEVIRLFQQHDWPGNVRELENVMERAFNIVDGSVIEVMHLPVYIQRLNMNIRKSSQSRQPLAEIMEKVEKEAIQYALSSTNGNRVKAAKALGLSRSGLYKKLEKYRIETG